MSEFTKGNTVKILSECSFVNSISSSSLSAVQGLCMGLYGQKFVVIQHTAKENAAMEIKKECCVNMISY